MLGVELSEFIPTMMPRTGKLIWSVKGDFTVILRHHLIAEACLGQQVQQAVEAGCAHIQRMLRR